MFRRIVDTLPELEWFQDNDDDVKLDLRIWGGMNPIHKFEIEWGEMEFTYDDGRCSFHQLDIDYQWHSKMSTMVGRPLSQSERTMLITKFKRASVNLPSKTRTLLVETLTGSRNKDSWFSKIIGLLRRKV